MMNWKCTGKRKGNASDEYDDGLHFEWGVDFFWLGSFSKNFKKTSNRISPRISLFIPNFLILFGHKSREEHWTRLVFANAVKQNKHNFVINYHYIGKPTKKLSSENLLPTPNVLNDSNQSINHDTLKPKVTHNFSLCARMNVKKNGERKNPWEKKTKFFEKENINPKNDLMGKIWLKI